jgi:hypothetical protein
MESDDLEFRAVIIGGSGPVAASGDTGLNLKPPIGCVGEVDLVGLGG